MELETVRVLGEALAIGILVGAERYRHRVPGEKSPAGVRTFAAIGLLGGVCALIGHIAVAVAAFAAIATLTAIAYYRDSAENLGTTSETAALLTFWLGYLVKDHETAAIAAAIVLAILLVSKRPMHDFVKGAISTAEFNDTLKFLAVVFVVYPVLPDHPVGPYGIINPRQIWTFVVLISTISYVGYFLVRVLGASRGFGVSALLGGVASTTALTVSLAQRSREIPALSRLIGAAVVIGNAVQFPRLLLLVWVFSEPLAWHLMAPFTLMFVVGVVVAAAAGGFVPDDPEEAEVKVDFKNPYSFTPALKFALYIGIVLVATPLALEAAGERGVYAVAALTGMASVSAFALPLTGMVGDATLTVPSAAIALLAAITANAIVKWVLAFMNGSREMAAWLGVGLALMLATGATYLFLAG